MLKKACDYLVIGGGSGGLASARRASLPYGVKVILVENKRLGGTCVNVGCVPKKIYWNAALISEVLRQAPAYGFLSTAHPSSAKPKFDWHTLRTKTAAYITRLNEIYERNLEKDDVEFVPGIATFTGKHQVRVDRPDSTPITIEASHILIAVGGAPLVPVDIPGHQLGLTSDDFFSLTDLPTKVAIVGAGYIAVEFAGVLNALGSETHLFVRHNTFLRSFDPLIQNTLGQAYDKLGIHVHHNTNVTGLSKSSPSSTISVAYTDSINKVAHKLDGFSHVFWCIGRVPLTKNLGLESTQVQLSTDKKIIVDKFQNTTQPGIYAVGDVCDRGFELTPVAIAAGRRLSDRLFGGKTDAHLEYSNIPSVIFSHPEAGTIGLTESEARKVYGDNSVKVYNSTFTGLWYSMMKPEDKHPCSYKLICVDEDEKVVGLHIVGDNSAEILQGFGVAIKMGAKKSDFDNCVAIHPTSAEEIVTMR